MAGRFGAVVANTMSGGARLLGYAIYYLLRFIYRPRYRMAGLAVLAAVAAAALLLWWIF